MLGVPALPHVNSSYLCFVTIAVVLRIARGEVDPSGSHEGRAGRWPDVWKSEAPTDARATLAGDTPGQIDVADSLQSRILLLKSTDLAWSGQFIATKVEGRWMRSVATVPNQHDRARQRGRG